MKSFATGFVTLFLVLPAAAHHSVAAGYDTAEAIPGARMLVIDGMGHELPVPYYFMVERQFFRELL